MLTGRATSLAWILWAARCSSKENVRLFYKTFQVPRMRGIPHDAPDRAAQARLSLSHYPYQERVRDMMMGVFDGVSFTL